MQIQVNIPDGRSNAWEVSSFEVSEKDATFHNMRAAFKPGQRFIKPGKYKKLTRNGYLIMSNTPAEISDHYCFISKAKKGGHILINGLGLGVALSTILDSECVESVTVIEKSADVIFLVGPSFRHDKRVNIIHADAFNWKPPRGVRYNAVWHDIWDDICTDNVSEMTRLHRKYGKRTDWQGSWCKEECKQKR